MPKLTLPRLITEDEELFLRANMQEIGDVAMSSMKYVDIVYISHAPKIIPRMIGFVSSTGYDSSRNDQLTLSTYLIYREPEDGQICLHNPTLAVDGEGFVVNSEEERIAYFVKNQGGGLKQNQPKLNTPLNDLAGTQISTGSGLLLV